MRIVATFLLAGLLTACQTTDQHKHTTPLRTAPSNAGVTDGIGSAQRSADAAATHAAAIGEHIDRAGSGVSRSRSRASRVDDKAGVILDNWDRAK